MACVSQQAPFPPAFAKTKGSPTVVVVVCAPSPPPTHPHHSVKAVSLEALLEQKLGSTDRVSEWVGVRGWV